MNDILEKIAAHKRKELTERKELYPTALLERSPFFATKPLSLRHYLGRTDLSGVIAEFKRKSPSAGTINGYAQVEATTIGYMQAGASALSVLTDSHFFGGSSADLTTARKFNLCPILRKDFTLDEYHVLEAKSIGADAILLIAALLSEQDMKALATVARGLGLEVLLEVHSLQEVPDSVSDIADLVGVNNRNLKTFETSVETSFQLAEQLPADMVKVSESGLTEVSTVLQLKEAGYQGFLMGEAFMRHSEPELAARSFLRKLKLAEMKLSDKA